MSLFRTWDTTTRVNQAIADGGSELETNKNVWRTIFDSFGASSGASVWKSCDGGSVSVGSSSIVANGDIVYDNPGSAHSWIVYNLGNGSQVLFSFDFDPGSSEALTGSGITVRHSPAGAFSGGTTTDDPTAVDSQELTSASLLGFNFGGDTYATGDYMVNAVWTTDGDHVLVNVFKRESTIGRANFVLFSLTLDDAPSGVGITETDLNWFGFGGQEVDDAVLKGTVSGALYSAYPSPEAWSQGQQTDTDSSNPFAGNRYGLWSIPFAVSSSDSGAPYTNYQGYVGRVRDIYTAYEEIEIFIDPSMQSVQGAIFELENGDKYANLGFGVVPWTLASVDLGNADPVPDVPAYLVNVLTPDAEGVGGGASDTDGPYVENIAPTPGTYINADDHIIFDVVDGAGIADVDQVTSIVVHFLDGSSLTAWDGSNFSSWLDDESSHTPVADGFTFELAPDSAWGQSIARVVVEAEDDLGNESTTIIGSWLLNESDDEDELTPVPVEITDESDVDEVDHVEVALARLPSQFRGLA